jgi:hypothetical protein
MPRYKVTVEVVMRPQYDERYLIVEAKNSDEAEAKARVKIREIDDDIDYISEVRSVKLDD